MKEALIIFGEMGCGKTYQGKVLASWLEFDFFDGDSVIPEPMLAKVENFEGLSRRMVFEYVSQHLGPAILEKANNAHQKIIVAQALYCDEDRKYLQEYLEANECKVFFYYMQTSFVDNLRYLLKRSNKWKWVKYWLANKPFFEEPTHTYLGSALNVPEHWLEHLE